MNSPADMSALAKRIILARAAYRHEKIGGARLQQRIFGQRARRHQAYHLALDHCLGAAAFGVGRVFHLLANCDAEALADQPFKILLRSMDGHAAHRDVVAQMLAALGQRDVQRFGRFGRVVKEKFVKVAHAVKQQIFGVGRLDLLVLGH